jgi:hypothetical protein
VGRVTEGVLANYPGQQWVRGDEQLNLLYPTWRDR